MKDSTKQKVKEITEQLEQGVKDLFSSERYAEYLRVMGKFHRYSANNCLLIAMQRPDATHVAGFKKWQEMGRNVTKGQKAITILAPIQRKFLKETKNDDGEVEQEEVKYLSFMPAHVFDISQTEGKELPDICEELSGDIDDGLLERIIGLSPVPVKYKEISGEANGYYSHEGYIVLKKGMSGVQTAKTAIHEIAHAILHNKDTGEEKGADRDTKEVQAESTAYTVCSYLGIDTSDYSFGYVAGWSRGKDVKQLQESLEVIRKTASGMIQALENADSEKKCA